MVPGVLLDYWESYSMSADEIEYSVIIPLYNKRNGIVRAIDSVLSQVYQPVEIIIVDDGSTDGSVEKVRTFDDSRIHLISQDNRGVSAARNRGINASSCRYLAFLDADDAWTPDHLSAIEKLIRNYPQAGAFATSYFVQEAGHKVHVANFAYVPTDQQGGLIPSYFRSIARGNSPVWSSAVCVPRSTFEKVGLFPEGVRLYEDLHMWTRIALAFPIAYVDMPSATYFRNAENRACNIIVPTVDDLEFSSVILTAIDEGRIKADEAVHAIDFINRYALLNAFKAVIAGNRKESRSILKQVKANNFRAKVRKALIMGMSFFPTWLAGVIWRSGVLLKTLMANLFRGRAPVGD